MREMMARVVRNAIGRVVCIVADYSAAIIAEARRMRAMVIADQPSKQVEKILRAARDGGELSGLVIVNTTGNAVPPYKGAPPQPRRVILANGDHSSREAVAFSLHSLGHDAAHIADWMNVDVETAKTFVRRAEQKNRSHPELAELMERLSLIGED